MPKEQENLPIGLRKFAKNDSGFVCVNCGKNVPPLKVSSRNHCPFCLHSLHVDIYPGDRLNVCKGLLKPLNAILDSKKGVCITFKCDKCGTITKNKSAEDDDFSQLLSLQKSQILTLK